MDPIAANDPRLRSWLELSPHSDFPIQNLPFGIFRTIGTKHRVGVAIGEYVIDMAFIHSSGCLAGIDLPQGIFEHTNLNNFIRLGKLTTHQVRGRLSELLRMEGGKWTDKRELVRRALLPMQQIKMSMPVSPPNYTDFYSSREHAMRVGTIFRGSDNALPPNWRHMPLAYHGRVSSIVPSGVAIRRPRGQIMDTNLKKPVYGITKKLDFELEMAFVTCCDSSLGTPITTAQATDYIFGMVIFNDWSARDMQQWEYMPLGPFTGKNFASSISPWVVTMEALVPYCIHGPSQHADLLSYLCFEGMHHYDIALEVDLQTAQGDEATIVKTNYKYVYWNMCQQLAHHTVGGCNVQVADLYASGTISGSNEGSHGSMLELTWDGQNPIHLPPSDTARTFLEDGDTVIMRAYAKNDDVHIGFGSCTTNILPAFPHI